MHNVVHGTAWHALHGMHILVHLLLLVSLCFVVTPEHPVEVTQPLLHMHHMAWHAPHGMAWNPHPIYLWGYVSIALIRVRVRVMDRPVGVCIDSSVAFTSCRPTLTTNHKLLMLQAAS